MKRKISSVLYKALPIIIMILFFGGLFQYYNANKTPILQVMAEPSASSVFPGETKYYNVYQNGKLEEIDEFSKLEVEHYSLREMTDDIKQDLMSKGDEVSKTASSAIALDGMSSYIKINYDSNKLVSINIFDQNGVSVAQISKDKYYGFDDNNKFDFTPLAFDDNNNRAILYMPRQGYKVVFSYGNESGTLIDFSVEVSTLDRDGFKTASVSYNTKKTESDGVLTAIDGATQAITRDNIGTVFNGDFTEQFTDWELPDMLKVNMGEHKKIDVIGTQALNVLPQLNWSSSNESIVDVTNRGVLVINDYGNATIAATDGNKVSVCDVTVMKKAETIDIEDIEMVVGERVLIKPKFTPALTTEVDMNYSISKSGVIQIDEFGVIYALAPGTVEVTGETSYGVKNTFKVTVVDNSAYAEKGNLISFIDSALLNGDKVELKSGIDGGAVITEDDLKGLKEPVVLSLPYSGQKYLTDLGVLIKDGKNQIIPFSVYRDGKIVMLVSEPGTYGIKNNKKEFVDIKDHWANDTISFITARDIYTGLGNNKFGPNGSMTRAMFAQVLANFEGVDLGNYQKSRFKDVPSNLWYTAAVEWAADKKLVSGYGGGYFGPNDLITREQLVVALNNYLRYKQIIFNKQSEHAPFADEERISIWAREAVVDFKDYGLVSGLGNNTFAPKKAVDRSSVAQIIRNVIEKYLDQQKY